MACEIDRTRRRVRNEHKFMLLSVRKKWAELILDGKKTIDVRRRRPSAPLPIQALIYVPKVGVAGEVTIVYRMNYVDKALPLWAGKRQVPKTRAELARKVGMKVRELRAYQGDGKLTILVLENPIRYDQPVSLKSILWIDCQPHQSWRYLDYRQTTAIRGESYIK
jgi:predicted transcriptional regulator